METDQHFLETKIEENDQQIREIKMSMKKINESISELQADRKKDEEFKEFVMNWIKQIDKQTQSAEVVNSPGETMMDRSEINHIQVAKPRKNHRDYTNHVAAPFKNQTDSKQEGSFEVLVQVGEQEVAISPDLSKPLHVGSETRGLKQEEAIWVEDFQPVNRVEVTELARSDEAFLQSNLQGLSLSGGLQRSVKEEEALPKPNLTFGLWSGSRELQPNLVFGSSPNKHSGPITNSHPTSSFPTFTTPQNHNSHSPIEANRMGKQRSPIRQLSKTEWRERRRKMQCFQVRSLISPSINVTRDNGRWCCSTREKKAVTEEFSEAEGDNLYPQIDGEFQEKLLLVLKLQVRPIETLGITFGNRNLIGVVKGVRLVETLQRYSEHDHFEILTYLREKRILIGGDGDQPFLLSPQFLQSVSKSFFPSNTGKIAAKFSGLIREGEKVLNEGGINLAEELQCGNIFQLFAFVSSGKLSNFPYFPDEGVGEVADLRSSKSKAADDDELFDGDRSQKRKGLVVGDLISRRKKGFPGIMVIMHRASILFMDEISTGLDSSTTYQIVNSLKQSIHILNGTAVIFLFKLTQLTLMSFISMTLFIRTVMHRETVEDGGIYLGVLLFTVIMIMFNGMAELPLTIAKLPVFYKQRDLLLYPAWAYSFPSWIPHTPIALVEVALWVCMTYYVIGFDPNDGRFLKPYLLLVFVSQMASGLFRCIVVTGRNMIIANTFGSFALLAFFTLGGSVLSREQIKKWWIWGYWLSPLLYAQDAKVVNEFLGAYLFWQIHFSLEDKTASPPAGNDTDWDPGQRLRPKSPWSGEYIREEI